MFINWGKQRKANFFGKNKKAAQLFADKMDTQLKWVEQNGTPHSLRVTKREIPTVREFLTEWKDSRAKVRCQTSTYVGYAYAIDEHLIPTFGHLPLNQVDRESIPKFISTLLSKKKARGTIENYLVPLKAIFYQAIEDGLAQTNPVARLEKLFNQRKDRRAFMTPLEQHELAVLLQKAHTQFSALYPLLLCAVRTGMRQGELVSLQWGDVDFLGGFIEVRRGVVRQQETTPKSHKIRRVDMSQHLQNSLQSLKEIRQLQAMSEGKEPLPWVFLSPQGKRWDDRNLRRAWARCLDAAGISQIRFHDLRHTYASWLAQQGTPPKYI